MELWTTITSITASSTVPQMTTEDQQQQAQQGGFAWMPGATTVGVVFDDGVILAAEKRVTYGYFIMSKGGKKVFKVLIESALPAQD